MKQSIWALPALLRSALLLASASQHSFSVSDDLLAFPQYEVKFAEDYVTEQKAETLLHRNAAADDADVSQVEQYRVQPSRHADDDDDDEGRGDAEETKMHYEHMMLDGQRYLCAVPQVAAPERNSDANNTVSKAEEEKELARATERGWELIGGMQDTCVYFISGWWSYRFCYNDGIRQFHQIPPSRGVPVYPPVEDPAVEGFTLGMYPEQRADGDKEAQEEAGDGKGVEKKKKTAASPTNGELVQRGETRYLVQRLEGGTKCDLTGKDRRIDVQFHCNPQSSDRISLIKETSTCTYLMVIQTPRLCNDVAFLPPQKDQANAITCSPVLAEHEVAGYERDLRVLRAAEAEAQVWEANQDAAQVFLGTEPRYQVAGDILVGSHGIVPEDVKLEKSAIVGGGKETYVDTVASSDGTMLSKEALEKLGLGSQQSIEELRKKLDLMAKGQKWKLDVIDTPRGREYRGIIGSDEDEEEEEAGGVEGFMAGGRVETGRAETGEEKKREKKKPKKKAAAAADGERDGEGSQEEYFKEEL